MSTPTPDEVDRMITESLARLSRIFALESTLRRFVTLYEETQSNSEGHYPQPDSGCIECTLGTVPNRLNIGLCAYHRAKELLS